ncbi:DUF6515 family protein [Chryseolinea sp. T2]|uniref:DUF6515 family protein n=1 Tax=Chryseolinea sp. T2 TaxID=3129255 RepID=UPI00307866C8
MQLRPGLLQSYTSIVCMVVFIMLASESYAQHFRGGAGGGRSRQPVSRNAGGNARSINGGAQRSPQRTMQRPSGNAPQLAQDRNSGNREVGNRDTKNKVSNRTTNSNNKTSNIGNKTNVGNKVNIDNSTKNVNINVDRSRDINIQNNRNTVVNRNTRVYPRPPYAYGGRRYYCYHPYYYHPYRPFYWGPVWHPWGFFVATLAATAIIVTVENQQYHYDQGVYYVQSNGGYTVVQAPVGATIKVLPEGSEKVVVNETTNNYYYGGTYYEKKGDTYSVVPPTAGTVVENLPEGGEEVKIGDQTYVKFGETYYQPIQQNGKSMYEVADVQQDAK